MTSSDWFLHINTPSFDSPFVRLCYIHPHYLEIETSEPRNTEPRFADTDGEVVDKCQQQQICDSPFFLIRKKPAVKPKNTNGSGNKVTLSVFWAWIPDLSSKRG